METKTSPDSSTTDDEAPEAPNTMALEQKAIRGAYGWLAKLPTPRSKERVLRYLLSVNAEEQQAQLPLPQVAAADEFGFGSR